MLLTGTDSITGGTCHYGIVAKNNYLEGKEMLNNKCTKLAAAMGITFFAGAAQAAYMDIAVNGGFETGDFTGWTQFPGSLGTAGQTVVAPGNASGFAANLNEPNPAANIIKQANQLAVSFATTTLGGDQPGGGGFGIIKCHIRIFDQGVVAIGWAIGI